MRETLERATVYNFEVADFHTYFAGSLGAWVHNDCTPTLDLSKLPRQLHHFASNKSKIWTEGYKKIAEKYGLDLDGAWNKEVLPHLGRHPNQCHEFVLNGMKRAMKEAGDDAMKFQKLFDKYVKEPVRKNPELLRKSGWTDP